MRITTDRKAALADRSNRNAALHQLLQHDASWARQASLDDVEQWVDDLINEWVDELTHDLECGISPA